MSGGLIQNPSRLLLPVIYLAFVSIGLPDGTFGIAWPRMHLDLGVPVELAGSMLILVTLLSAAFGLYVAAETTLGLWAGSVLVVSRGMPQSAAGWSVAAYFGSITVGRIVLGLVVDRFGNRRVIQAGLALAAMGSVLFIVATNGVLAFVALGLCGLGLAPVYPGLMHETPRRFTVDATPVVIGRQAAAAYLGSAILSPGVGALARFTSLEIAGWVVLVAVIGLMLLIRLLDRATERR